ncbi:MAG: DUF3833 family protein [Paracoccaceae bacterium]
MDRRLFLTGALALGGCASPTVATRPVTLDQAFVGRKRGAGVFRVWLTGEERRFRAHLDGLLSRGRQRLTVVEDFTYDDGQTDRLTWVFDRSGPEGWTGRREETVGQATVVEENGEVRLAYTAVPPRVYRRAKLSENWRLWNRHQRRRPRSRIHLSSANVRCGWRWNTAMIIKAELRR